MRGTKTSTVASKALLDIHGVAKLLDCSARHVRRLADTDKMPRPVKLGALVRWNRQVIEEWINKGCPVNG